MILTGCCVKIIVMILLFERVFILKISEGYLLRSVAGKNIVVSVGRDVNFNGMLTLNETGVFFWNLLQKDTTKKEMLEAVLKEYDVSSDTALQDIENFINKLRDSKILED